MVRWPGRLEILSRAPLVVADSAHNGDSAQKLVAALRAYCPHASTSCSARPITSRSSSCAASSGACAVATRSCHPRAAEPAWLQRAGEPGLHLEVSESVAHALIRLLACRSR